MKGPIKMTCPLCEKPVYRVDHRRNYSKRGLNVTIWFHGDAPCFVVDDLFPDPPNKTRRELFDIVPLKKEKSHARA
jgi:hypothetical protein